MHFSGEKGFTQGLRCRSSCWAVGWMSPFRVSPPSGSAWIRRKEDMFQPSGVFQTLAPMSPRIVVQWNLDRGLRAGGFVLESLLGWYLPAKGFGGYCLVRGTAGRSSFGGTRRCSNTADHHGRCPFCCTGRIREREESRKRGKNKAWKCLAGWCPPRSSKSLDRTSSVRSVGSIPMHFRHFLRSHREAGGNCGPRW